MKSGVEAATKNMTVETETVNSVAQAALGPPDRTSSSRADAGGILRAKSSNDVIKSKKDKKKTSRKAPSTNVASGRSNSTYPVLAGRPQSRLTSCTFSFTDFVVVLLKQCIPDESFMSS